MLRTLSLPGPAGRIEALLDEPDPGRPIVATAVFCHPHPQFGGTMHNKVVFRMARAARSEGAAVLRFNFRGVGNSTGTYDGGAGEQDDLRAAVQSVRERYPGLALTVGGFSFGARVALQVACSDARVEKVIAVGAPVNGGDWSFLRSCVCPKHFIHSEIDEFGSRRSMVRILAASAGPKAISWIAARDHFFSDALDEFEKCVREAVSEPGRTP